MGEEAFARDRRVTGSGDRPAAFENALSRARAEYELNARRSVMLGASLSGDPAWNMLLDLLLSEADGRRLSVSALCIGSGSSHATACRYLALLVDAGLVARTADSLDGRRTYVALTDRGTACMLELLVGA